MSLIIFYFGNIYILEKKIHGDLELHLDRQGNLKVNLKILSRNFHFNLTKYLIKMRQIKVTWKNEIFDNLYLILIINNRNNLTCSDWTNFKTIAFIANFKS